MGSDQRPRTRPPDLCTLYKRVRRSDRYGSMEGKEAQGVCERGAARVGDAQARRPGLDATYAVCRHAVALLALAVGAVVACGACAIRADLFATYAPRRARIATGERAGNRG